MRLMDNSLKLQSPAIFKPSSPLDFAPSPTLFVPIEAKIEPTKVYASPYINFAKSFETQRELEQKIRHLEDERQTLQHKLAQAESARLSSQNAEQQGAMKSRSLQSSILAMQASLSHQAAQVGSLQLQLGQQQRDAQAWAQEVNAARAQLRRQQDDHRRELDELRGE